MGVRLGVRVGLSVGFSVGVSVGVGVVGTGVGARVGTAVVGVADGAGEVGFALGIGVGGLVGALVVGGRVGFGLDVGFATDEDEARNLVGTAVYLPCIFAATTFKAFLTTLETLEDFVLDEPDVDEEEVDFGLGNEVFDEAEVLRVLRGLTDERVGGLGGLDMSLWKRQSVVGIVS